MSGGGKSKEDAEVDELLRAAQDEILLNLSVDAHTTTSSSSLDPDLARRFNALKSPTPRPPPPAATADPRQNPTSKAAGGHGAAAGEGAAKDVDQPSRVPVDDLEARFAALKGSLGSSDGGFQKSVTFPKDSGDPDDSDDDDDDSGGGGGGGGEGVSKKEVDKVMQWAMDAACLDPSNSDDENEEDETEDFEQQQDDEEMKQVNNQGKGKTKKWFFF